MGSSERSRRLSALMVRVLSFTAQALRVQSAQCVELLGECFVPFLFEFCVLKVLPSRSCSQELLYRMLGAVLEGWGPCVCGCTQVGDRGRIYAFFFFCWVGCGFSGAGFGL